MEQKKCNYGVSFAVQSLLDGAELETLEDLSNHVSALKTITPFQMAVAKARVIAGSKNVDAGLAKAFVGLMDAVNSFQGATQKVIRAVVAVNQIADAGDGFLFKPICLDAGSVNINITEFDTEAYLHLDAVACCEPVNVDDLVDTIHVEMNSMPFRSAFIAAADELNTRFSSKGDAEFVALVKSARSYRNARERLLDAICRFNAYSEEPTDMLQIAMFYN